MNNIMSEYQQLENIFEGKKVLFFKDNRLQKLVNDKVHNRTTSSYTYILGENSIILDIDYFDIRSLNEIHVCNVILKNS